MLHSTAAVKSLAVALLGLLLAGPTSVWGAPGQPNLLFILVDDLGKEWVSCYGAEGIETTNIDALAASGMKFNNAWCMPQCTPTRVTLLTGQYPFHHGWTNHWDVPRWGRGAHFDPSQNLSFANVLRDAGYATCAAGKWQIDDFRVEPRALDEAGFDDWCMWTGYEAGNRASGNRYWEPYLNTPAEGSRTYEGRFGPDVYCDYLIRFMREHKQQPMLLYYAMTLTHTPLTTTPDAPDAEGEQEQFAGMVRYADKLVGRLVEALEQEGIRDNTMVIFTTDNGTGSHQRGVRLGRQVSGGKVSMSEQNGVAQPFIVSCPGAVAAGAVTDALIDFTDILPTFAELGGGAVSAGSVVDGRSFAPLILGKADDSPRDWILSMGGGPAVLRGGRVAPELEYDERVIRGKRFKLWIDAERRPIKLYDLQNDPWEETNLIDSRDPEAVEARERLIGVADQLPERDAAPAYVKNPRQVWEKK